MRVSISTILEQIDETLRYFQDEFPTFESEHNQKIWDTPISGYAGGLTPIGLSMVRLLLSEMEAENVHSQLQEAAH